MSGDGEGHSNLTTKQIGVAGWEEAITPPDHKIRGCCCIVQGAHFKESKVACDVLGGPDDGINPSMGFSTLSLRAVKHSFSVY